MSKHKNAPIGVFDSGLGGLTVARAISRALPGEELIYLGDTARVPYGTRSANTVIRYARTCGAMLAKHGQQIDRVVRLEVDSQKLMARVAKRFAEEGRADDNPESFKVRPDAYLAQTAPLVPYYETAGKLRGVDGMADVESVSRAIAGALDAS